MNFFLLGSCLCLFYINVIIAEGSKASSPAPAPAPSPKPSPSLPRTTTTTTTTTMKNSSGLKLTSLKETDKLSYPKKVNSIKKNHVKSSRKKIAADITDKFRDLPDDDLAFIKELDKQFKLHGGKVKIKVENNKNGTETKNSKRTIDGELGYGYAHNGYNYDPPKFMFYPYSQQDISSNAPGYFPHGEEKTEVSIEPSYSYELKSQAYVTQNQPQIDVPKAEAPPHTAHAGAQSHYEEPVIVLRIPGPAKYATHLQQLLQKYLEIRAAQYLHILEEAEQGHQQQQLQQLDYGQTHHGHHVEQQVQQQAQAVPEQHDYVQQAEYHQQNSGSLQAEQYPEIDHVYHSYKSRHQTQHQGHAQTHIQQPESYYASQQSSEEHQPLQYNEHQYSPPDHFQHEQQLHQQLQQHPQFYYTHHQQYAQPEGPPANLYHQVLLVAMPQPQATDHAPEHNVEVDKPSQPIYVQDQHEPSITVPIAENNPRPSHTKVIFTNKNEHAAHDYQMYQLPSIQPHERHAPTSTPDFHQDFHQQPENLNNYPQQQQQEQHYTAAAETVDSAAHHQVVAITQRPYNYHAHNVKARARGQTAHVRRAAATAKEADKDLQKIRDYVRDKLGAESGSAVEFKTTQIIQG